MSNALKYCEGVENIKRIHITLISSGNGRAVLTVKDNGPGISEEIDGHMRIESASGTEVRIDFAVPAVGTP